MKKIAPILSIMLGIYWIYGALVKYPLWHQNGPGGGLFPAFAGTLAIISGVWMLVKFIKDKNDKLVLDKEVLRVIVFTIVCVGLFQFLGMMLTLLLFMFGWLFFVEHIQWKKAVLISAGTVFVLWIVFDIFLKIPVPMGIFEYIFR